MLSKIPDKGATYLIAFTDNTGTLLSGGNRYRLNLLANFPAVNFWSVPLYEAENASGLANGQPFPSLGSRDKPMQNEDGITDLYFGPKAPEGKTGNWMATVPGKRGISPSEGSMVRPRPPSRRSGSLATSKG